MNFYEILGLKPGASEIEIKKAYFKMIRLHPPESDPEQFQKIREAYEQLKDGEHTTEAFIFPDCSEPAAKEMLEQIETYRKTRNTKKFRDTCEKAWKCFPNHIQFLYYLIIAQRQCGNTGKAVKNAELLVSKEPENKWFQKELATSYIERGFTQKAYSACEKAYTLGCRELDFILIYAMSCENCKAYNKGREILLEVIRQEKKWSKQEIPELVEVYFSLYHLDFYATGSSFLEITERFCSIIKTYGIYMDESISDFAMIIAHIAMKKGHGIKEYEKAKQLFSTMRKNCHSDSVEEMKNAINTAETTFDILRFINDPRFGETIKTGYEVYYNPDLDSRTRKFAIMDTQLCMIEERADILKEAKLVQQEFPDYYKKLEDFLKKLETEKSVSYLKNSLQKEYRRIAADFAGGVYYEKYPQEKEKAYGTVLNKGTEDEPYIRQTKKIGRNDPCPCGSGKKYKHCCMNKQK